MDFNQLFDINTGLVTKSESNKIRYPFLFIENVSEVEFTYLQNNLSKGDIPLFLQLVEDGRKQFVKICDTELTLRTIKLLSQFEVGRKIVLKISKKDFVNVDEMIPMLLLEGD